MLVSSKIDIHMASHSSLAPLAWRIWEKDQHSIETRGLPPAGDVHAAWFGFLKCFVNTCKSLRAILRKLDYI